MLQLELVPVPEVELQLLCEGAWPMLPGRCDAGGLVGDVAGRDGDVLGRLAPLLGGGVGAGLTGVG